MWVELGRIVGMVCGGGSRLIRRGLVTLFLLDLVLIRWLVNLEQHAWVSQKERKDNTILIIHFRGLLEVDFLVNWDIETLLIRDFSELSGTVNKSQRLNCKSGEAQVKSRGMSFGRFAFAAISSRHATIRHIKRGYYNSLTRSRLARPLSGKHMSILYLVSILIHPQKRRLSRSLYSRSRWRFLTLENQMTKRVREIEICIDWSMMEWPCCAYWLA